jgi:hypothetical protein
MPVEFLSDVEAAAYGRYVIVAASGRSGGGDHQSGDACREDEDACHGDVGGAVVTGRTPARLEHDQVGDHSELHDGGEPEQRPAADERSEYAERRGEKTDFALRASRKRSLRPSFFNSSPKAVWVSMTALTITYPAYCLTEGRSASEQIHPIGADRRRGFPRRQQLLEVDGDRFHGHTVGIDEPIGLVPIGGLHQPTPPRNHQRRQVPLAHIVHHDR